MERTEIKFQQFHDAYGEAYGAKIDRIAAERAWKRLSDKDKRAAIAGITAYRDYCQSKGIAMKYPSGYLNLHRWEIEVVKPAVKKTEHPTTATVPCGSRQDKSPTPPVQASLFPDMETW